MIPDADDHVKKMVHRFKADRQPIMEAVVDRHLRECRKRGMMFDDAFCEELADMLAEIYLMGARHGMESVVRA